MPKLITSGLQSHLAQEETTLATLWTITRTDGQSFYFTDHDTDIPFSGNVFESAFGYNRTAVSNQVGLSVDNLDVEGFFDSSALTDADMRAGLFDFAQVRIAVVNYENLADGELKMRKGRLGEVIYNDSGVFRTELRGLAQAYSQSIVELYTPQCRADLGDARCKVPILPDVVRRNTAYSVGDTVRTSAALEGIVDPIFLAHYDDDLNDEILGAIGTPGTEAALNTSIFKYGTGSVEFSPTGALNPSQSFVSYPNRSEYQVGNGEFTIEFWVRFKSVGLSSHIAMGVWDASIGNERSWYFYFPNGGAVQFVWSTDGSTVAGSVFRSTTVRSTGTWYHFAATRDSSNNIRLFMDGTQLGTHQNVPDTFFNSASALWTGKVRFAANDIPLNGYLDDVRFVVGAAVYTSSFTPPTGPHASGLDAVIDTLSTEDFDDRIYVCTVAGTTAASQPTYDTTVGNDTVDGTATFKAQQAWTRAATVAAVVDNRTFSITVDEARAVDDWFTYGAVIFETGNNDGLGMEIKSSQEEALTGATTLSVSDADTFTRPAGDFLADGFEIGMTIITTGFTNANNNGTFTITNVTTTTVDIAEGGLTTETGSGDETMTAPDGLVLFLAMPFDIQVGDKLSIYPGCDKKLNTCIAKFNNAINFRGEPYLPGPDEYLSIQTKTGQVVESGKG